MRYYPLVVGDNLFKDAPAIERWAESIYYRLLAHELLPKILDKILYIDNINSLLPLYNQEIASFLYVAASHTRFELTDIINRLRLGNQD